MTASMAYALTRMHARIAERPLPEARKRLLAVDDFGYFLQSGARVGFDRWLARLGPTSTSHQVELSLRMRFRELLNELGHWLPARWLGAIDVLKLLPELPALDRLMRGGPIYPWMHQDPLLAPLIDEASQLNQAELLRAFPALADGEAGTLSQRWLNQAVLELPPARGAAALQLGDLLQSQLEPDRSIDAARQAERVFRRQRAAAVRVVAFVALLRQDFEFLRGQLVRRCLLHSGGP